MRTSHTAELDLTVSEVAELSGVAPSAVRFYDRHGLVRSERNSANQRRFGETAPCLIHFVRVAQRVGLSVREISALLDGLPDEPSEQDWENLRAQVISEAERRISELSLALDDIGAGDRLCRVRTHGAPICEEQH